MIDIKKLITSFYTKPSMDNEMEGSQFITVKPLPENQPVVREFEDQQTPKPLALPKLPDKE